MNTYEEKIKALSNIDLLKAFKLRNEYTPEARDFLIAESRRRGIINEKHEIVKSEDDILSQEPPIEHNKNTGTLNSFGTKLIGKTGFDEKDGSYITTAWIVIFYIPLIPLRSLRIYDEKIINKSWTPAFSNITTKYSTKEIPLHWNQIIPIMLKVYIGLAFAILGICLITSGTTSLFIIGLLLLLISTPLIFILLYKDLNGNW